MEEMTHSQWTHVFPSWVAGPQGPHSNSKFFRGITTGGIYYVEDRLCAIHERFPDDRSSGHNFLEVRVNGPYERYNSPQAISFPWLIEGIEKGKFPLWSAFTNPAFGIDVLANGAILSDDPAIVEMARQGHIVAIQRSKALEEKGLGLGWVILWLATDSRLHKGPLSEISVQEAWDRLADFLVLILRETGAVIALEYKPAVPGVLDFIPTMKAAIAFCNEVNRRVGRKALLINLEFAHALIGGQTVAEAVRQMVEAGLFGGLIHVNSAQLAVIEWNEAGTEIIHGTSGDDADWPIGEGGEERWDDQQEAIAILDALGVQITAEHDIAPQGENPMECYALSRGNLETMIADVRTA